MSQKPCELDPDMSCRPRVPQRASHTTTTGWSDLPVRGASLALSGAGKALTGLEPTVTEAMGGTLLKTPMGGRLYAPSV